MYRALRDHDPVHHVVPRQPRRRLLRAVPARRRLRRRARPRDVLLGAGPDRQLRRAGNDRAARQPADGDAGSAGAHRVPQAGVARLHPAPGRGRWSPRSASSSSSASSASRANGGGDIVTELFKPLPSMVVAHYLGVPDEDRDQFDGWTEAIVAANTAEGGIAGALETLGDALGEMMAYFTALIERRASDPERRHHLASGRRGRRRRRRHRRRAVDAGASRSRWSPAATTPPPACSAARSSCCTSDPTSAALLLEDPDLIADAVDEFLRLTVAGAGPRPARSPATSTIGDTTIPRRARRVLLLYGSANRDERQYGDDAGELDVDRKPTQHPDLQPRRAPLPGRGRRPHAVAGRARGTAGPLPRLRGRRGRNRLGRRQLRPTAAVGAVPGSK